MCSAKIYNKGNAGRANFFFDDKIPDSCYLWFFVFPEVKIFKFFKVDTRSFLYYSDKAGEINKKYYENTRSSYEKKRDMICAALDQVGLTPFIPQGSYYVLADMTNVAGNTAFEKAMHILEKTNVASVPGNAFYKNGGKNMVRFCFAKEDHIIEKACEQIIDAEYYFR